MSVMYLANPVKASVSPVASFLLPRPQDKRAERAGRRTMNIKVYLYAAVLDGET